MKRLLAYSTIAHAGYMLMAVSAMLVMQNSSQAAELGHEINRALVDCCTTWLFTCS